MTCSADGSTPHGEPTTSRPGRPGGAPVRGLGRRRAGRLRDLPALEGATYAFDHTEVGPPFEGRGLADRLVTAALDEVRSRGGSVLPYCPYVRAWLEPAPGVRRPVPADQRERFDLA